MHGYANCELYRTMFPQKRCFCSIQCNLLPNGSNLSILDEKYSEKMVPEVNNVVEVSSVDVVEAGNKKFLAYKIVIKRVRSDPNPVTVCRRYNDFLELYNSLKKEFPTILESVKFPRKVFFGNFSPNTINERSQAFVSLLRLIMSTSALRTSDAVTHFFQFRELSNAMKMIEAMNFREASFLVDKCFKVTSLIHTDRSPTVLQNLCLLLCLKDIMNEIEALELAVLAVRRFDGVSDFDLLRYFGPLLNIAIALCEKYGKDSNPLHVHMEYMQLKGISLSDASLYQLVKDDINSNIKNYHLKNNSVIA